MSELNNVNSIATPKQGEFKPSVQPTNAPQEHGGVSQTIFIHIQPNTNRQLAQTRC